MEFTDALILGHILLICRAVNLNLLLMHPFGESFALCNLTNNYSFIHIDYVQEKCIYGINNNEYFIALVHDEEDHD